MSDYIPEIITIVDEEGNEHRFEELDRVETENAKYVALIPAEDEDLEDDEECELIILKVIDSDEETYLEPIEDENEFCEIAEIFEERLAEEFSIEE